MEFSILPIVTLLKAMRNSLTRIKHAFDSASLRTGGVQIGHGCAISLHGTRQLSTRSRVSFADSSVLCSGYRLQAEDNSEILVGANVFIAEGAKIVATRGAKIEILDGCYINHDVSIIAQEKIVIGKGCVFGPYCYLIDNNHSAVKGQEIKVAGFTTTSLFIGDDVWLGVGATILAGAQINSGAVIGARAVVTKTVPEDEIWAGIPARKIGERTV